MVRIPEVISGGTEVVKDEVNTAIFNALAEHGIEIPYNYVKKIKKKDTEDPS